MVNLSRHKKLLYEHQVLWARYDIRDHYLNNISQEVYENIGQVLSLVRVQLSALPNYNETATRSPTEPGKLVGQVIKDLRAMCRSFNPETELIAKLGLINTLESELRLLDTDYVKNSIRIKGIAKALPNGVELIVFRMLQEIISSIKNEYKDEPIVVTAIYEENDVTFIIEYSGKTIKQKQSNTNDDSNFSLNRLTLLERAELIDAKLRVSHRIGNKTSIKLIVPFKSSLYGQDQSSPGR